MMLRAGLLGAALPTLVACRTPAEPPAPGLVESCGRILVAPVGTPEVAP